MQKDPLTYIPEAAGFATGTADRLSQSAHEAKDAAAEAARRAQAEFQKLRTELARVATKSEKLAKENPWAAAGTMLGVGILLGAIGYRLFSPKPTIGQVLGLSHLPDSARKQMKAIRKYF